MPLIDKLPWVLGFKATKFFQHILVISSLLVILAGCGTAKYTRLGKTVGKQLEEKGFGEHFTGLLVVDPVTRDTLINHNAQLQFTPASNAKILTLFTAIKRIPSRLPVIKYVQRNDSIWFFGTGDPTQLHPVFRDSSLVNFLKIYPAANWVSANFNEGRFAPGWAWEDFPYNFSPERSPLPLYGNTVWFYPQENGIKVMPGVFRDSMHHRMSGPRRMEYRNRFRVPAVLKDTLGIPMVVSPEATLSLLQELGLPGIGIAENFPEGERQTVFGMARDSLCRLMMIESDNFLAEQLMLVASSQLSDTLSFRRIRDSVLADELKDLPQQPRWVDGSGLSRYNLMSPATITAVLNKLYNDVDRERLFRLFPKVGENGTLENWPDYGLDPYLIAKTGTLGNNFNLSGYLITESGRVLIFSFMNNHFTTPLDRVKRDMQQVLLYIRSEM